MTKKPEIWWTIMVRENYLLPWCVADTRRKAVKKFEAVYRDPISKAHGYKPVKIKVSIHD